MPSVSRFQRTIASDVVVRGVGFFHGSDVTLRMFPAGADTGVVFERTDLPDRPRVRAHVDNVVPSPRRTTVRNGPASVEMVEHVLAALAGLQVDNCWIEIDAPEAPGCDGSSLAYVEAIAAVGTVALGRPRKALTVDRPMTVREGESVLTALPWPALRLGYDLDYGADAPIGRQSLTVEIEPEGFAESIAPSRTFVLEGEVEGLRRAGIGLRTSAADILVFGKDGVVGNALRFPDECVRHKILDMLGDLSLIGMDVHGHLSARRTGHAQNVSMAKALLQAFGPKSIAAEAVA